MSVDRRSFLKNRRRAHAGAALSTAAARQTPKPADVIVVGAGAFGAWTAYYLRQLGARVRLVDAYGPGNSRATSGDETRGVRSSYGDRGIRAELWTSWANRAIDRWTAFDAEWGRQMKVRLFFTTGDFIFRAAPEVFTERTQEIWKQLRIPFELPKVEDVAREYPQFDLTKIAFAMYDPRAGVVRARRACEVIAEAFRQSGGEVLMGHATLGTSRRRATAEHPHERTCRDADGRHVRVRARAVVSKSVSRADGVAHPDAARARPLLRHAAGQRSLHVSEYPELELSWRDGLGCAAARQSRLSRASARIGADRSRHQRPRIRSQPRRARAHISRRALSAVIKAPLLETRACHYEMSASGNFIIDRFPGFSNVWVAGGGTAEGFKFGPVTGEYIAKRVLGIEDDARSQKPSRCPLENWKIGNGKIVECCWIEE